MFQAFEGRAVKGGVEGVFVAVPEVDGGAARIAERVDVEHPQALGIEHEIGEGGGGVGVIDIPLLPESCHHQMIFDDECDNRPGIGGDAEALKQRLGEADAAFGVAADALGLADVVEEQGEVEQGRVGGLVEGFAVFEGDGLGGGEDEVEFADGVEGVDVGGVAVVILVLDKAGEGVEGGDEPPEDAEFVHEGEGGVVRADLGEDGAEAYGGVGRSGDRGREQGQGVADEFAQLQVEAAIELLAVAEDADEAHRILGKRGRFLGRQFPAAHDEAVEALAAGEARDAERVADGAGGGRAAADGEGEPALDELRHAEDRLRGAVVIGHEPLDAQEEIGLGVSEVFRDAGLVVEVEGIGRARADEMEFVADAQEEIVGLLGGFDVGGFEVTLGGEIGEGFDAEFHTGHPDGVLEIAQAADAVLHVGLLVEDGVGELGAARGLVVQPGGDVGLGVLARVEVAVGLGEGLGKGGGAGDVAGLEEGGLGLDVLAGFDEDFLERAGGVADLEAAIPEQVEDFLSEVFLERLGRAGFGLGGEKEHHVDVAPRGQFAAAVTAEGEERRGHR